MSPNISYCLINNLAMFWKVLVLFHGIIALDDRLGILSKYTRCEEFKCTYLFS